MNDNFKQSYKWTELCKQRTGMTPTEFEKQYQTKWTPEITLIPTVKLEEMQSQLQAAQAKIKELEQAQEWIEIDSAEDVDSDTEVLLYDGCGYSIDYVDICVEYGNMFFANGSDGITHYKHLLPPQPKGE